MRGATRICVAAALSACLAWGLLVPIEAQATTTHYWVTRVITGGPTNYRTTGEIHAAGVNTYDSVPSKASGAYSTSVFLDVKLPSNSTIKIITGYGHDTSASDEIQVTLYRALYSSESGKIQIAQASSEDGRNVWSSPDVSHAVDNNSYAYWVRVDIPDGEGTALRIWNVEISYTTP